MDDFKKGLIGKTAYSKKVSRMMILDETLPEGTVAVTIVGDPIITITPMATELNAPCLTACGEIVIKNILHWYIV